ncbi:MAG: malto-oligosyltrehalose synthase [Candidatus Korobacteraceae bacterium]
MPFSNLETVEEAASLAQCLDELSAAKEEALPLSTYRLQFNRDFRFEDARRLVSYLYRLGVTHCYASPILKARSGSVHGYDIVDHNQINPEIGTEEEFRALALELKAHGMGLILDTVPNHMGIGPGSNPWWQDVLENGRASAYAEFFDIDWEPLKAELRNKVLIPILGSTYGDELERGNIQLRFLDDRFSISYFDSVVMVDPQTIPMIFDGMSELASENVRQEPALCEFRSVLADLRQLPRNSSIEPELVARRQREIPVLHERLARLAAKPAVARVIEKVVLRVNGRPGESASFDRLHALLEAQAYRLAFWRVSGEEINYRRFFDINDLVGLRMEDPRVFAETHRLIRRLLAEGLVTGIRIDHPDGLLNPVQYFARLQMLYAASRCCGPEATTAAGDNGIEVQVQAAFAGHGAPSYVPAPLYLVVEKILERGEHLPQWPVDGTVGYDFTNLVNGVLIDGRHERYFTNLYQRVTGTALNPDTIMYESKKLVMYKALASEVNVLSHLLDLISMHDRRARDFTRSVLRNTIREAIACFPVYRTYIDERGNVSEQDRLYIEQAMAEAKRRNPDIAPAFDFLQNILLLKGTDEGPTVYGFRNQLYFTLKFQQLTGPIMAKGLEDTTCYAYNRFVSVNEVGGSPAEFGISLEEFHRGNQLRAQHWPHSMLATSTHDTKRSEDVRARLDVLSEMPRHWAANVMKWRRMNRARKIQISDGRLVPDNNEEYLLYQTIVGALPMRMESERDLQEFTTRIQQYMDKAAHEAKVNLSWLNPNPEYVDALKQFVARILSPSRRGKPNQFYLSLEKFMPAVKYFGAINSLTQTLLKLTCPGVPDVYQGQEMFDFSLVDPDNRRPVDFKLREGLLTSLREQETTGNGFFSGLLQHYEDGRIKLWLAEKLLNLRRERRALFSRGSYLPLSSYGGKEDDVIAFARSYGGESIIVAAPRFAYTLMHGAEAPPIGAAWNHTSLRIDVDLANAGLRNYFNGESVPVKNGTTLLCSDLFAHLPFALLTS